MAQLVNTIYDYGFKGPYSMATDGSHVWVTNYRGNSVTQFNASDGSHRIILSDPSYNFVKPIGIATDGSYVWVTNYRGNSVTQFNASDGLNPIILSDPSYNFVKPKGIATDGSHVWVANFDDNSVTQFNASDGLNPQGLSGDSYKFDKPYNIATDGSYVWVTNYRGNSVTQFNASDGLNPQVLSCDNSYGFQYPTGIATDGIHVWVGNYNNNTVTQFDASDGLNPQVLSDPSYNFVNPKGIATDGSHVWVTNSNSVTQFNASDGSNSIILSDPSYNFVNPKGIATDGSYVWVTNYHDNSDNSVTQFNASDGLNPVILKNFLVIPQAICSDGENVWVVTNETDNNSLLRFSIANPTSPPDIYNIANLTSPPDIYNYNDIGYRFYNRFCLASDGSSVWIGNFTTGTITQVNALTGDFVNLIELHNNSHPSSISLDISSVWVADPSNHTVWQLNRQLGTVERSINVSPPAPLSLVSDGSSVWIGNSTTGTITQVNALTGDFVNLIELHNNYHPSSISLDISSVWVADPSNHTVWQLNRQLGTVEGSISVSPAPDINHIIDIIIHLFSVPLSLVSDGSSVWVSNIFNYVTQMSAYDGSLVNHFLLSSNLLTFNTAISSDGSYVYVGSLDIDLESLRPPYTDVRISPPYINVINATTGILDPSYSFDISGQIDKGIATDGTRVFTDLQKGVYEIYQNNVKNIYPLNNGVIYDIGFLINTNVSTDGTYTWVIDHYKSVIYQFQTFSGDNKVITYPNNPTINQSFSVSLYTPTINVIPGFKTMFVEPHQYQLRQNEAILSQNYTYDSSNHIITFNEITLNSDGSHNLTWYDATRHKTLHSFTIVIRPPPPPPCFKADTKIYTDKGYRRIQDLRKGDLVKTATNTFIPIFAIGTRDIYHPASSQRIPEQLYVCSQDQFPEVFEDLVVTGYHAILKLSFENKEEEKKTKEIYDGKICITEHLYRIPACVESRTKVYDTPGTYPIYHLALENDDYYMNYGINANGLWVETCSKRYLLELSGMELIR